MLVFDYGIALFRLMLAWKLQKRSTYDNHGGLLMDSKPKKRRGRPPQDKRIITFTVDRSVYEAFHRFPQGMRSSYANRWLKKAFVEKTNILLYEDNAGNFFLHQEGSSTVYQDMHKEIGPGFVRDAEAIREGQIEDWSPESIYPYTEMQAVLEDPETTLIATYLPDGTIQTHHQPRMKEKHF